MSIKFVHLNTHTGSSVSLSNTAGNFLFLAIGYGPGDVVSSITDTAGNIWHLISSPLIGPNGPGQCAYVSNCKQAASNTITLHGVGISITALDILEYSGVSPTSPLDSFSVTTISPSDKSISQSITTSADHDLLISVCFGPVKILSGNYNIRDSGSIENAIADVLDFGPQGVTNFLLNVTATGPDLTYFITFFAAGSSRSRIGSTFLGTYSGATLQAAFSNTSGYDLMQVVDEYGNVVWNLDSNGITSVNPTAPTGQALLGKFQGSSFLTAFNNPTNLDVLQIVNQGFGLVFRVDYQGNSYQF